MAMIRKSSPMTQKAEAFIRESLSSSSFLVINKALIKKFGPDTSAVISLLIDKQKYFEKKHPEENGWFFFINERLEEDLCLALYSVRKIKKQLVEEGVLIVDKKGVPSKDWFKIDYLKLGSLLDIDFPRNEYLGVTSSIGLGVTSSVGLYIRSIEKPKSRETSSNISLMEKNFTTLAEELSNIIQSKKKIKHTPAQIKSWAKYIKRIATQVLPEDEEQAISRIGVALRWYKEHIGEQYVPVIESGQSLFEKFGKLESAIEREKEGGFSNPARRGLTGAKPIPNKYGKIKTLNQKMKERGEDDDDM